MQNQAAPTRTRVKRRKGMQSRGTIRSQLLVDCARSLLEEYDVDQISLADVAAAAGVPKSSAYHFFPDVNALFAQLAGQMAAELKAQFDDPLPPQASWEDIVALLFVRGCTLIQSDVAMLRVLNGPKTPLEIKRSDRERDRELSRSMMAAISRQFNLPDIPDREGVFFRAIEIFDLFLGLAVLETGKIDKATIEEATRASLAYLHLYIPQMLAAVGPEQPKGATIASTVN